MGFDMGDFTGLVAVVLGSMIFLIPVAGLTLRFTLKPLIEAYAKARGGMDEAKRLSLRVQALEIEMETVRGTLPMSLELPASASLEARHLGHKS